MANTTSIVLKKEMIVVETFDDIRYLIPSENYKSFVESLSEGGFVRMGQYEVEKTTNIKRTYKKKASEIDNIIINLPIELQKKALVIQKEYFESTIKPTTIGFCNRIVRKLMLNEYNHCVANILDKGDYEEENSEIVKLGNGISDYDLMTEHFKKDNSYKSLFWGTVEKWG